MFISKKLNHGTHVFASAISKKNNSKGAVGQADCILQFKLEVKLILECLL